MLQLFSQQSIPELTAWFAACPTPLSLLFTLFLLQLASIYLLTTRTNISFTGPISPLKSINPNAILTNNSSSPSSLATPTALSNKLTTYQTSKAKKESGKDGVRAGIQKQKNGYRDSVMRPLGNGPTAALLLGMPPISGYLKKRGKNIAVGWQRRFFVVELAYVKYYETAEYGDENPLAAIDIRQMAKICVCKAPNERCFEFDLADGSKKYTLKAKSAEMCTKWVTNLQERRRCLLEVAASRGEYDSHQFASSPTNEFAEVQFAGVDRDGEGVMRRPSMSITGKHELKEGELDGIRQLKQTFPDIDSSTLLRFYRARKGHVQNATDMLIDNIKWRQETFPVSFDRVREECAKGKYVLAGRDKEGDLVLYLMGHKMGPHTYKSIEDHMESVFFMLEIVASEILDDPMDKFTVVYNRLDVDKKNRDLAWAEQIGKTLANHYPERMKKAFVIPANIIFRSIWKIVKVFFDPDTASKISFLSGINELYKYIDQDQVPMEMGGGLVYNYDVNHLFTKEIPGVTAGGGNKAGTAQVVYKLPSHFKGSGQAN